jgi:hypothetical protein
MNDYKWNIDNDLPMFHLILIISFTQVFAVEVHARMQIPYTVSKIFMAALWPGMPLTAPPLLALEPHINIFS